MVPTGKSKIRLGMIDFNLEIQALHLSCVQLQIPSVRLNGDTERETALILSNTIFMS